MEKSPRRGWTNVINDKRAGRRKERERKHRNIRAEDPLRTTYLPTIHVCAQVLPRKNREEESRRVIEVICATEVCKSLKDDGPRCPGQCTVNDEVDVGASGVMSSCAVGAGGTYLLCVRCMESGRDDDGKSRGRGCRWSVWLRPLVVLLSGVFVVTSLRTDKYFFLVQPKCVRWTFTSYNRLNKDLIKYMYFKSDQKILIKVESYGCKYVKVFWTLPSTEVR